MSRSAGESHSQEQSDGSAPGAAAAHAQLGQAGAFPGALCRFLVPVAFLLLKPLSG